MKKFFSPLPNCPSSTGDGRGTYVSGMGAPLGHVQKPFVERLCELLNQESRENASNTPDYILAEYLENCLKAFERATTERDDFKKR